MPRLEPAAEVSLGDVAEGGEPIDLVARADGATLGGMRSLLDPEQRRLDRGTGRPGESGTCRMGAEQVLACLRRLGTEVERVRIGRMSLNVVLGWPPCPDDRGQLRC